MSVTQVRKLSFDGWRMAESTWIGFGGGEITPHPATSDEPALTGFKVLNCNPRRVTENLLLANIR